MASDRLDMHSDINLPCACATQATNQYQRRALRLWLARRPGAAASSRTVWTKGQVQQPFRDRGRGACEPALRAARSASSTPCQHATTGTRAYEESRRRCAHADNRAQWVYCHGAEVADAQVAYWRTHVCTYTHTSPLLSNAHNLPHITH